MKRSQTQQSENQVERFSRDANEASLDDKEVQMLDELADILFDNWLLSQENHV